MSSLSPERWKALSPYLDDALEMREEERQTLLASLRANDPVLADALASLLNEHKEVEQEKFLEQDQSFLTQLSALAGQTLGGYTLVSPLGQGGMGSVWLARRSDGRFERQAAVKFLNVALLGRGGEERFKREGRILGQLTHPHIAELLDAGVSASGQPYLVLEYVNGQHIDDYCDERKLDVEERIRLFLDVLAAVAHAHTNLTVHRDIKPSNVLVTKDGQVKLVDFGIAKLLQHESQPETATLLTREMGAALTPEYAAPEQVNGESVTTATDVYGLGLLLYVLLTGQHPVGRGPHSTANLIKAIVETEAPRMSAIVVRSGVEAELIAKDAARRAVTARGLQRRLQGDLDTIVAKALKKKSKERYPSATMFSDDLSRYLRHEPIRARPDTLAYRGSRFLRRQWIPVATVVVVIASLAIGLYVANRERVVAQQRFGQLRELANEIFDLDEDIRSLPGSTQARQRLVSAALEYLNGLAPASHGDVELAREIAEGYWRVAGIQGVPTQLNLGEPAKAETSLKRASNLMESVLVSRPHDRLALLHSAGIAEERMILAQEDHRDADALADAGKSAARLDEFLRLGNAQEQERVEAAGEYANIALAYLNMHRYAAAIPCAQRTAELARPIPSAQQTLAAAFSMLAMARRYEGDLPGAFQDIQEAGTIAEQATYTDPTQKMIDEYGIFVREGLILGEDGGVNLERPRDAIEPLQKALAMSEEFAARDPNDAVSRMHIAVAGKELGNILRRWNPKEALSVYDQALRRVSEVRDNLPATRDKAVLLAESSYALLSLHRAADAKHRVQEALSILKETKDYPAAQIELDSDAAIVASAEADAEAVAGDPKRALLLYQELLNQVMAANADTPNDLRDAPKLSRLYHQLSVLDGRTGATAQAKDMQAHQIELWRHWEQKLPQNAFIRHQVEVASLH